MGGPGKSPRVLLSILTLNHVKLHNICDMLLNSYRSLNRNWLTESIVPKRYTHSLLCNRILYPFNFIQLLIIVEFEEFVCLCLCTKKKIGLQVNSLEKCCFMTLCDLFQMSTPHPIKTRLERTPRKQRRKTPLVRSHSMPESLDKLSKKKKFLSNIGMSDRF